MSYLYKLNSRQCIISYAEDGSNLSNLKISLYLQYGYLYFNKTSKIAKIHLYEKLAHHLKYSLRKKILVLSLVVNNVSSLTVDRCNINIKENIELLSNIFYYRNVHYLNLLNGSLQQKIKDYYMSAEKYKRYEYHKYEKQNKIVLPVNDEYKNSTSSLPTNYPSLSQRIMLETFIKETSYYVLSLPEPPSYYNPFDVKHTKYLDSYFSKCNINYTDSPPLVSYDDAVTKIEKLFPNKKYLYYDKYKESRCYFCNKKGHLKTLCPDLVDINDIQDPYLRHLAVFVMNYPVRKIKQRYGNYSNLIWTLPVVWNEVKYYRNKFWDDYGFPNPFADTSKYWSFGDYRRRDIGYWYAIGASRYILLNLIKAHQAKVCKKIPRMQLKNHKSMEENQMAALPVLHEYLQYGILKIIPEEAAHVILPMAVIVKPGKVRIVVDGKPINVYTPSMKFKPNNIEEVKYTIFKDALVESGDAMHAFYQCKATPQQSLRQCIKFYWPPLGKFITCCFTTVFFGSKLSCYIYKKYEDVLNNFFRLSGIYLNSFYDDAVFYAQNNKLSAAVMGSFIKRIYYSCGRLLNESKTDLLYGTYTFKFCGFQWNSRLMKFRPLEKLISSSIEAIDYILSNEGRFVLIKSLVKIIGKLIYAGLAINMMSILLSPLKDIMRTLHKKYGQDEIWFKKFKISPYLCHHLKYLRRIMLKDHISPIIISKWDVEIVSDVSDRIAGSYDSNGKSIIVPLSLELRDSSSTLREVYGIYVALYNRLYQLKGKIVRVLVDNLGTATILMRNGSRLYDLNLYVYKIIRLCQDNNITLWVRWLRRDIEAITFADDLSKCVEVDRWIFDENILFSIAKKLKIPAITLDLLADACNAVSSRYISRYFDGKALDFNWMKLSFKYFQNETCYLNPPFRGDYLMLSIKQIIEKKIQSIVVLPKWPSAVWYTMVRQHASIIVELQDGYKYFTPPDYMTIRQTKTWSVILVYFSFPRFFSQKFFSFNPFTFHLTTML